MLTGGETVVVRNFAGEETGPGGFRQYTWGDPVEVDGVGIDLPKSTEPREASGQEKAKVDLVAFFPPGCRVGHRDRVTVRGQLYEVEGPADALVNFFTGTQFMTEANLRRIIG